MKPVRTLILMASETRLRLAENAGVGKGVHEILTREAKDFGDLPSTYADMPGRGQAAPGGVAGHQFERPTSEREQARGGFAGKVIETALAEWHKGKFDRLVVAAPPKMLGALRDVLPGEMSSALLADLDKDLTKLPVGDLPDHLDKVMAV